ncbi:MAG: hypothetical protein D8M58_21350 [Calditrichaeota bacterium]|nr:MAG: hypothetical protein DWQ03_00075 [Calditrichota bacterium]MBL1207960.1 hypothetical protein [Calditrichota bacterium]NOG47796.1 hypothetical protein [Calditrichota bacterium]
MKLKNPLITYSIVSVISLIIALIMYLLGGSLAEVTGNADNFYGIGFKASGFLGGFIIIFIVSQSMIIKFSKIEEKLKNQQINLKVYLKGTPEPFKRTIEYKCTYTLFNETSGEKKSNECEHRWEAGFLTLDIPNINSDDLVQVRVSISGNNKEWRCDYFYPRTPEKELKLVQ